MLLLRTERVGFSGTTSRTSLSHGCRQAASRPALSCTNTTMCRHWPKRY